jgi:hypothetical protein
VIPSLDIVEVTTGNNLDANLIAQLIAGAAKSNEALPPNPQGDARLASLASEAAGGAAVPERAPAHEFVPVPRAKPLVIRHALPTTLMVDRSPLAVPRPKPGAIHSPAPVVVDRSAAPDATAADLGPAPTTVAPVAVAAKS